MCSQPEAGFTRRVKRIKGPQKAKVSNQRAEEKKVMGIFYGIRPFPPSKRVQPTGSPEKPAQICIATVNRLTDLTKKKS
jgi:hypothetical protein